MSNVAEKGKSAKEELLDSLIVDFDGGVGKFTLKHKGKVIKEIKGGGA